MTVVGVAAAAFRGVDVGAVPALLDSRIHVRGGDPTVMETSSTAPPAGCRSSRRLRPDLTPAQAQAGFQPWFKAWLEDNTHRPGFPNITADRPPPLPGLHSRTHPRAPGPFAAAPQPFPAALGSCSPPPAFCSASRA